MSCCGGVGEDEDTKKQKQRALIDAAFKIKTENSENNSSVGADGNEESGDGAYSLFCEELFLYLVDYPNAWIILILMLCSQ